MRPQRYVPKRISEVRGTDTRISVMGTVVSTTEGSFVLEESSGRAQITSGTAVKSGDLMRVFCTVADGKLKADTIQSLNGLDLNLYQKVEELYRKIGV